MAEIERSKNNVVAFLEHKEDLAIIFNFENYKALKDNFERFNTSKTEYKPRFSRNLGEPYKTYS